MRAPLRVLTVRQPWAGLIVGGLKNVENRLQNIAGDYRGPVAIHAAKTWDHEASRLLEVRSGIAQLDIFVSSAPRGAIVGVVDLTHVFDARQSFLSEGWGEAGCWRLYLENARPLAEPVPWTGRLGLTRLPDDVAEHVWAQVPGEAVA